MTAKVKNFTKFIVKSREFLDTLGKEEIVQRSYFDQLVANLDDAKVDIIAGVRRSGKTTLLKQLAQHLIFDLPAPKANIIYFKLDHDYLGKIDSSDLDDLLKLQKEKHPPEKGKIYLLLDEIQEVEDWEWWAKRIFDDEKTFKLIITGSSGKINQSSASTALTGRNNLITVFPFSFKEYLTARGFQYEGDESGLAYSNDVHIVKNHFEDYIKIGGFPEVAAILETDDIRRATLKRYFIDIIERDIKVRAGSIRAPFALKKLADYLAKNFGSRFSARSLSDAADVTVKTVQNYLEELKTNFLFTELPFFSYKDKVRMREKPKIYCIDHGMVQAAGNSLLKNRGRIFENIFFIELLRRDIDAAYYLDNSMEADFTASYNDNDIAVEITSTDSPAPEKNEKLLKLCDNSQFSKGIIISGDEYNPNPAQGIAVVPLWLALLREEIFIESRVAISKNPKQTQEAPVTVGRWTARPSYEQIVIEQRRATETGEPFQEMGIMALIDIVKFTSQVNKFGDHKTVQFIEYFIAESRKIIDENRFEYIKSIGDAILFFGQNPNDLIELMLDFFVRRPIPGRFGFDAKLRMIANSGFFTFFKGSRGEKADAAGSESIKAFRQEKYAGACELVVSDSLFTGLKPLLEKNKITHVKEIWPDPLKGFEALGPIHSTYKLIPPREDKVEGRLISDTYKKRLETLFDSVKKIRIFGNLYPDIEMDDNFIDLSLDTEWKMEGERGDFREFKDYNKRHMIEDDLQKAKCRDNNAINAKDILSRFNKGIILGVPGAGKTTILKHLAFQLLLDCRESYLIYINCMDLDPASFNGAEKHGSIKDVLGMLSLAFLFPKLGIEELTDDQKEELEIACNDAMFAWQKRGLTIFIDALDESPSIDAKDWVVNITQFLMTKINNPEKEEDEASENRVFISSRTAEYHRVSRIDQPVFHVNPITMHQMQQMARQFYSNKSETLRLFNDRIWQEPVVKSIAGTPLTAMLLLVYFETYKEFNLRYPTYDLIVKFVICKAWMGIKTGDFQGEYRDIPSFFTESDRDDFLEKKPEIANQYNALSSLAFETLFNSDEKQKGRTLQEDDILDHFRECLKVYYRAIEKSGSQKIDKPDIESKAKEWLRFFITEHMFISTGHREYLFIHSTIMEFLAARHLVNAMENRNSRIKSSIVNAMAKDVERHNLESLPLACGHGDYKKGAALLQSVSQYFKDARWPSTLPFRCLSEVEATERKALNCRNLKKYRDREEEAINRELKRKEWVYLGLKNMLFSDNKKELETYIKEYGNIIPLCMDTFWKGYILSWDKEISSEIVARRKLFLKATINIELVNKLTSQGLNEAMDKIRTVKGEKIQSILKLDLPGSPFDKNFSYYKENSAKGALIGIYGSPNLKHSGAVVAVSCTPNGKTIISSSFYSGLKLWDVKTGREISVLRGHKSCVTSCVFSSDGKTMLTGSYDNTIKLWNVETWKEILTFGGHKDSVGPCTFSPCGKTMLSGSHDNTLKLWNIKTGKELLLFQGHKGSVSSCAFSPNGKTILSGSTDNTLKLWNAETGREIHTFEGHKDRVTSCAFSPDGKTVVSGSYDNTSKLWDVETGKELLSFEAHNGHVETCVFLPNGKAAISGSYDSTLKLWNVETGRELRTFEGHKSNVLSCGLFPDGKTALSGSFDNTIKLWDIENGREILPFEGHNGNVETCASSPDGKTILSGSSDNTLKLWNVKTGREILTFEGHEDRVISCAFSPDGKTALSGSGDQTLKLWNVDTGREILTFEGHNNYVFSCAFSPNGKTVLADSEGSTLKLWDVDTGRKILTFEGHKDPVISCAFSPDGKTALSGSHDNNLKLWDIETGKESLTFEGHKDSIRSCAFSPDGKTVLSGSHDNTLKLWNIDTGREILTFEGHKYPVTSCTFSFDGKTVVSGSFDGILKLWDTEAAKEIETLPLKWMPWHIAFSTANPMHIITANANGTLALYDLGRFLKG